jgi:hypothetical protein
MRWKTGCLRKSPGRLLHRVNSPVNSKKNVHDGLALVLYVYNVSVFRIAHHFLECTAVQATIPHYCTESVLWRRQTTMDDDLNTHSQNQRPLNHPENVTAHRNMIAPLPFDLVAFVSLPT